MLIGFCVFLCPFGAYAMEETVWDFTQSQVPGRWEMGGLEIASPGKDGLHLQGASAGRMIRENDTPHAIDAITVETHSTAATEALLIWHRRGDVPGHIYQMSFMIGRGESAIDLDMAGFDGGWDPHADVIGMVFAPGSDLVLARIRLRRWNALEKIGIMAQSFWTFDRIEPYTINFLWGPVLTRTPAGLRNLFVVAPPPSGWSLNRLLIPVLGFAALALLLWHRFTKARKATLFGLPAPLALLLLLCAAAWLLWDLRMGMEFLSYAKTDYAQFIGRPAGITREVRNFENVYDVIWDLKPTLMERDRYVVLQPRGYPYNAIARYLTYPSVPLPDSTTKDGIRDWVVLERSDVTVDSDGRLSSGGTPLTKPGKIVRQVTDDMYLFQVNP